MERQFSRERDSRIAAREHIRNIDAILVLLIESGPELDPQQRQQLRQHLQQCLRILRLNSAEQLFEMRQHLNIEFERDLPPPSPGYPTKQDFQKNLLAVVLTDPQRLDALPPVRSHPSVTAIAEFAQYDWRSVQGRNNQYTLDYLYELGKVVSSQAAYASLFPETDTLIVDRGWGIVNGVQRALTLKTLGVRYVMRNKLNNWVKANRSDLTLKRTGR